MLIPRACGLFNLELVGNKLVGTGVKTFSCGYFVLGSKVNRLQSDLNEVRSGLFYYQLPAFKFY